MGLRCFLKWEYERDGCLQPWRCTLTGSPLKKWLRGIETSSQFRDWLADDVLEAPKGVIRVPLWSFPPCPSTDRREAEGKLGTQAP